MQYQVEQQNGRRGKQRHHAILSNHMIRIIDSFNVCYSSISLMAVKMSRSVETDSRNIEEK